MRKILIIAVASLSIAGCAPLQGVVDTVAVATRTIPNPVAGLNEQFEVEAAAASVRRVGLEAIRLRQCRASEPSSITTGCLKRSAKLQIQAADRKLTAALAAYRNFVRDNQTLNAISAAGAVRAAISDYKVSLEANGVKL